ncbi:MAG: hypothetical protein ACLQQ4_17285 [Bacteroidia bacterium]
MKKLSAFLAAMILFAGISFANPKQTQQATDNKTHKKGEKKAMTNNHKKADKKSETPAAK